MSGRIGTFCTQPLAGAATSCFKATRTPPTGYVGEFLGMILPMTGSLQD